MKTKNECGRKSLAAAVAITFAFAMFPPCGLINEVFAEDKMQSEENKDNIGQGGKSGSVNKELCGRAKKTDAGIYNERIKNQRTNTEKRSAGERDGEEEFRVKGNKERTAGNKGN